MIKRLIKRVLAKAGYRIERDQYDEVQRGFNIGYLRRLASPKTVIDIGVGYGTEGLYEAYPNAYFVMVEPVEEYKAHIENKYSNVHKNIHYCAVGSFDGKAEINVDLSNLQHSGFLDRVHDVSDNEVTRGVNVKKLDSIMATENKVKKPILLKVDTEGHELDVILGAESFLHECQYVMVELSVSERFKGSYSFVEFIDAMDAKGFVLFDIISQHFVGDIGTKYIDAVFKNTMIDCN